MLAAAVGLVVLGLQSEPMEVALYGDVIAQHMQQALFGTKMSVRSDYSNAKGAAAKGGRVEFGPELGARSFAFSVPTHSLDLGWFGEVTYRIANIELTDWTIKAEGPDFVIDSRFRGSGPQFIGRHSTLGRSVVPDVYFDSMKLRVKLRPVVLRNGTPSYTDPRVEFTAKMRSEAVTFSAFGHEFDLLDMVTGYRDKVLAIVRAKVRECLDSQEKKVALGAFLMKAMNERAQELKMRIVGMRFEGTTLRIALSLPK